MNKYRLSDKQIMMSKSSRPHRSTAYMHTFVKTQNLTLWTKRSPVSVKKIKIFKKHSFICNNMKRTIRIKEGLYRVFLINNTKWLQKIDLNCSL